MEFSPLLLPPLLRNFINIFTSVKWSDEASYSPKTADKITVSFLSEHALIDRTWEEETI
jgi:hypothetical protein